jgi:translation initiation factor 3 subunit D
MADGSVAFPALTLEENHESWGPVSEPEIFADIPYQPFSKSDNLGKAADFTGSGNFRGGRDRYGNAYGGGGDAYAYFHGTDDSSFQLVDSTKGMRPGFKPRRWQRNRRMVRQDPKRGAQQLAYNKNRDRDRQRLERKLQKKWGQTAQRRFDRQTMRNMDSSIDVRTSWELLQDIEFSKLGKLKFPVKPPTDYIKCGFLRYVDKTQERINPKHEQPLRGEDPVGWMPPAPTSADPVLQEIEKEGRANVFATDDVLSAIMAASRSFFSWDVIVRKKGDNIYFDKRPKTAIDFLTVDETAFQPPNEEGEHPNAPHNLAREASVVETAFKRQALTKGKKKMMKRPSPFKIDHEVSVAYRYRLWDLGDSITLAVRTQHDAVVIGKDGKDEYASVHTFFEWNPKASTGLDWRSRLAAQRSAVLASQLKDNAFKLGRWVYASLLASNACMRVAYISRAQANDPRRHSVLKVETLRTEKFAEQININVDNGWAIVRSLISLFKRQDDGTFVLLKDPSTSSLKIYRIPEDAGMSAPARASAASSAPTTSEMGAAILSGTANL